VKINRRGYVNGEPIKDEKPDLSASAPSEITVRAVQATDREMNGRGRQPRPFISRSGGCFTQIKLYLNIFLPDQGKQPR
jgi:biotin-(acetyl-CoA carboxylase) ligase